MERRKGDEAKAAAVPWFGARKFARKVLAERDTARSQLDKLSSMAQELVTETKKLRAERARTDALKAYSVVELEGHRAELEKQISDLKARYAKEEASALAALKATTDQLADAQRKIAMTDDMALLQEVGIYHYRHPLTDVVGYENALAELQSKIKEMALKDGGAVLAANDWTVNGSAKEGRAMVREYSKLMLRAFNMEADTIIRWLKPYKLSAAVDRLAKASETIERLGRTMKIQISRPYLELRVNEIELTADFLQKQAEEKEVERAEREKLREEQKAQREIEAERARLAKERQHHENALQMLLENGDEEAATRLRDQLAEVDKAIQTMDYRAANIRAGYVYLISNVGSFGEEMVKLGLTRRLNPMDRIRELSDASVPFNFDVHALFFSKDAVGIETAMHQRLSHLRVNLINRRREFFRATPLQVKAYLSELAGELLEFQEEPEAIEYRQTLNLRSASAPSQIGSAVASPKGKYTQGLAVREVEIAS
ncbi:MAG TPA: DUF4041 domain-containing protein [Methylovirgula sp.]|jgi:hypothetical protein|nr:DUF4041 domain-containing protein [Methylovirgula sp.]